MNVRTKLDDRLLRAMKEGCDALPGDLDRLAGYLSIVTSLLAERAAELEPSWAMARAAAAEIETLQMLEHAIAERAISVRAATLHEVRSKLAIWHALAPGADDGDPGAPRNRLIHSIDVDLARLARSGC